MKKVISIIASVLLHIYSFAVTVETTTNLNVYYPEYTKIDLVCGQMPKAAQKDVEFCCEAAFTYIEGTDSVPFDYLGAKYLNQLAQMPH